MKRKSKKIRQHEVHSPTNCSVSNSGNASARKRDFKKFNESISDRNTAEAWSFHRGWYASSFRQARPSGGRDPETLTRDIVAAGASALQSVAFVTAWSPTQACKQRCYEDLSINTRISFPRGNAVKSSWK